jgi:hypothetical protein
MTTTLARELLEVSGVTAGYGRVTVLHDVSVHRCCSWTRCPSG